MKRIQINKNISKESVIGTSLIGYILLTYDQLVKIFGEPNSLGDQYKVDWEWVLKLNDTVITIYNYKTGPCYLKQEGIRPQNINDWHVCGKFVHDLKILEDYIIQEYPEYTDKKLTIAE